MVWLRAASKVWCAEMGKLTPAVIALVCAAHAAQAEPRSEPTRWLLDLGYAYGWECELPFWGWSQYDAAKIAVVSAVARDQVGARSEHLGACVEFGVKQFLVEQRRLGGGNESALDYTLYGPDGAVWFNKVFDFSN